MQLQFVKVNPKEYQLICTREDGRTTVILLEMSGYLKHDLMHYVVEKLANLQNSFFGSIASGTNLDQVTPQAMKGSSYIFDNEARVTEVVVAILQGQNNEADFSDILKSIKDYLIVQDLLVPDFLSEDFCRQAVATHQDLMRRWNNLRIGSKLELVF